jgi:hypothetical protein
MRYFKSQGEGTVSNHWSGSGWRGDSLRENRDGSLERSWLTVWLWLLLWGISFELQHPTVPTARAGLLWLCVSPKRESVVAIPRVDGQIGVAATKKHCIRNRTDRIGATCQILCCYSRSLPCSQCSNTCGPGHTVLPRCENEHRSHMCAMARKARQERPG